MWSLQQFLPTPIASSNVGMTTVEYSRPSRRTVHLQQLARRRRQEWGDVFARGQDLSTNVMTFVAYVSLRIHVGNINTRTNVGLRALHWYVGLRAQHCRIVGALFVECHWFPGGWGLDMVCSHLPSKIVQGLLKRAPYNHTACMFFLVPLFGHDI